MLCLGLVLLLVDVVAGFGYSNAEELNVFEGGGWCVSYLDFPVPVMGSDHSAESCWEACQKSGYAVHNVDYWPERFADLSVDYRFYHGCFCQTDCLCVENWSDSVGAHVVSDKLTELPEACCGSAKYGYAYNSCVGKTYGGPYMCADGDFDSCAPGFSDWYWTDERELCEPVDDGIYTAYLCNDDFSISYGNATTCNVTDISDFIAVDDTIPAGWEESTVWCEDDYDDDGDDDGRRRLGSASGPSPHNLLHKGHHHKLTQRKKKAAAIKKKTA